MDKALERQALVSLTQPLYRAEQVRNGEALVAGRKGVAMYALMERAGKAAYQLMRRKWPHLRNILVLCGKGNNGGDGYVLARLAMADGLVVAVYQIGDADALSGDAATARDNWLEAGGELLEQPDGAFEQCEVIVDAMLGTGLKGRVRDPFSDLISWVNAHPRAVLSIDIPSGLDADQGICLGCAIRADHCITFVGRKRGLYTGVAREYTGQLHFDGLGIGDAFDKQVAASAYQVNSSLFETRLKPRHRSAHKGDFGKLIVVGGERGMPGSVRLSSEAALRTGVGLMMVVTRPGHGQILLSGRPELMVLESDDADDLVEVRMQWATALAVGPGLGRNSWGQALLDMALASGKPLLLDADALNLLSAMQTEPRDDWVLTPHPGEAARLLECSTAEIERDRFAAVQALQARFGGTIVLKGAGTLIYDGKHVLINDSGNPGMASGGMGDTLSGIIGTLLAQGIPAFEAAALGVCLHGEAADLAARDGERGLLASDLFNYLRQKVNPV